MSLPYRRYARILTATLAVLIGVLSITPDTDDLEGATDIFSRIMAFLIGQPDMGDKLAHFLAYGALATTAVIGFARTRREHVMCFITLLTYGVILEFIQGMGGVRTTDSLDLIANLGGLVGGIVFGCGLVRLIDRWYSAA